MFRYYLNGNLQADEDIKWKDAKVGFKRNKTFRALFFNYATDLVFQGDAYNYLVSLINATGFCQDVALKIEYASDDQMNTWDTLFDGIIRMKDIEHDEWNYQITCHAEDGTLSDLLLKFYDTPFNVLTGTFGTGTANTPTVMKDIDITRSNNTLASPARKGAYISDILTTLTECISQNQMTFVSDYFQTDQQQRRKYTMEFTTPAQLVGAGVNLKFGYVNYWGGIGPFIAPRHATAAATLNEIIYQLSSPFFGLIAMDDYYGKSMGIDAKFTTDGVSKIFFEHDLIHQTDFYPFTDGSDGSVPFAITITETQALEDGMYKLSMFTGGALAGRVVDLPSLSFKEVFEELNKECNLGMSIKRIAGVLTLRMEPLPYFFNATSQLTLDNVPNLKYSVSNEFALDKIKVGDGSEGKNTPRRDTYFPGTLLIMQEEWNTLGCIKNSRDAKNKYTVDWEAIDNQIVNADVSADDKLYLIECEDSGSQDAQSIVYEQWKYTNNTGTVRKGYALNSHLTNIWKVKRWLYNLSGDPSLGNWTIINDSLPHLLKDYSFDFPLSYADFKILVANDSDYITFRVSTNTVDNRLGWIDEVEVSLYSMLANFTLTTT